MPGHGLCCEITAEAAFYFSMGRVKKDTVTIDLSLHPFHKSSRCISRTVFLKVWYRPWNLSEMQILISNPRPS